MEPRLGHRLIVAFALFAMLLRLNFVLIFAFAFSGTLGTWYF